MTQPSSVWSDRTLVALANLSGPAEPTPVDVLEEVAIRFAAGFAPTDREYVGTTGSPRWHLAVQDALNELRAAGLVVDQVPLRLTETGRAAADAARQALDAGSQDDVQNDVPSDDGQTDGQDDDRVDEEARQ